MDHEFEDENVEITGELDCRRTVQNTPRKRSRPLHTSKSDTEYENMENTSDLPENNSRQPLWRKENLNPKIHNFDDNLSGIKANIDDKSSILDIFQLFFSKSVVNSIVETTNKYYVSKDHPSNKRSRLNAWKDATIDEMYRFLAISMLMCRVTKLSLGEYWSTNKLIETESFKKIMKRDRYLLLSEILYFSDDETAMNPLTKIHNIINKLRDSFSETFYPFQNICIGESLALSKTSKFRKQHSLPKNSRFEIKSYVLVDYETGYIQDFVVHCGRNTSINCEENLTAIEKSDKIVMTLLQPYLNKGHTLVTDVCCTSASLYLLLHDNQTNAYGMVGKARHGLPRMTDKLKKGEFTFRSTDQLLALKWMDKNEVFMLSTCHSADVAETKKVHNVTGKSLMKPNLAIDYHSMMGSIDKLNSTLNCINTVRETLKSYKNIFFHMLDLAVYNTYILHKRVTAGSLKFAQFHLRLIKEILEKYPRDNASSLGGRSSSHEQPFRLIERHFPSKYNNPTGVRQNARRRCVVCTKHKKRSETRYQCINCNVGLCIDPCFKLYHTKEDY